MAWTVLFDADYAEWLLSESAFVREAINRKTGLVAEHGPNLGRMTVDTLEGSALANLKELRVQVKGRPYRILFVFDPKRQAIMLVGGNKASNKRWYNIHIPIAEARYARHLETLRLQDEAEGQGQRGEP